MAKQHAPRFLALVEEAKQRIREIRVPELKNKLEAGGGFHVVDVREDTEWAAGHIPGAQHLSKGILERDIEAAIPDPNAEIILYCGGGFRSALAADNLQKMGYPRVLSLAGGWRAWCEAGFPVAKD
ncbi:MAG: rhodanese-like domain-containing protein [Terriglobia bacterium]